MYLHIIILLGPESQCTTQYVEKCYSSFHKCSEDGEDNVPSCIIQECDLEQEEICEGEKQNRKA